jgi:aminoglycoside phosphotransferase (APT) family kinase protein
VVTSASDDPAGVDLDALAAWSSSTLPQFMPPFSGSVIAGGRSNITVQIVDARGSAFVLRRPPLHGVLPTAHDMGREYRVIQALGPTPVPVPEAFGYCEDPEVIGAPFYVMSYVEGTVLANTDDALSTSEAARYTSGTSLIDALVALHAVDVDEVGLGGFARREDFVKRQLKRWHGQFHSSRTRDVPAVDRVHDVLSRRVPDQREATIVHGDFRLGNCIIDEAGMIQAVLDWEICTLGDPRADLGYVLATWAEPDDTLRSDPENPTLAPGFTTRDALLERYAEESGRDTSAVDYFIAFSFWRLGCILEGVISRMIQGARGTDEQDEVEQFLARADACLALAEGYAARL